MANELHQTGEEYVIKQVYRQDTVSDAASVSVGLYNDSTDALADGDNLAAITTEPAGANYARQSASLDTSDFSVGQNADNNYEASMIDLTYDVTDSSQSVDAYFVVVNFQSSVAGDTAASDNLFWTGFLDQTYDLSSVDQFTLQGAGLAIN